MDNNGQQQRDKYKRITSDQIYNEWVVWKNTGVVTEEFGQLMLDLAFKVSNTPKFCRYPLSIKDELRQECVLKMMRSIHNLKEE